MSMESSTTKATNGIPFSSGQGTPPETVASRRPAHKRKRVRYLTEVTRDREERTHPHRARPISRGKGGSGFLVQFGLFDIHVFEFAGLEDLAALQAFHKFGVFFAGHNLHTRVLACLHVASLLGDLLRRD
jgi:hypothetical protein